MNHETVRLVQNLDRTLRSLTVEHFFIFAQSLAVELERRGLAASVEARALQCALLPAARELFAARHAADESFPP